MRRKVILIEINEITWRLLDPLIAEGKLPNFALLKSNGAWASPLSVDLPPQLDPWITWTTVYTGHPQSEHGVFHLQQPPESIRMPRIWEICRREGLKVGVYGSLCSFPPVDTGAFFVPDTFAPEPDTFPPDLAPIQRLNLTYTRSARLPSDALGALDKLRIGSNLLRQGLRAKTCTRLLGQLVSDALTPINRWKRVALQPAVNFDIFSTLYKRHKPDFATFHTNHVAHYQHTYWRHMEPNLFPQKTSKTEIDTYGHAIEHGYMTADELLGKAIDLCDDDTVVIAASSMGQQPYISDLAEGKKIGQIRSLDRLAEILNAESGTEFLSVMSDQFNVYCKSESEKQRIKACLTDAFVDEPHVKMFCVDELDRFLTITLNHSNTISEESNIHFRIRGDDHSTFAYNELVFNTGMIKSGCHHPEGMLLAYGKDIPTGCLGDINNLDIAPTILSLLDVSVPKEMKGRRLL